MSLSPITTLDSAEHQSLVTTYASFTPVTERCIHQVFDPTEIQYKTNCKRIKIRVYTKAPTICYEHTGIGFKLASIRDSTYQLSILYTPPHDSSYIRIQTDTVTTILWSPSTARLWSMDFDVSKKYFFVTVNSQHRTDNPYITDFIATYTDLLYFLGSKLYCADSKQHPSMKIGVYVDQQHSRYACIHPTCRRVFSSLTEWRLHYPPDINKHLDDTAFRSVAKLFQSMQYTINQKPHYLQPEPVNLMNKIISRKSLLPNASIRNLTVTISPQLFLLHNPLPITYPIQGFRVITHNHYSIRYYLERITREPKYATTYLNLMNQILTKPKHRALLSYMDDVQPPTPVTSFHLYLISVMFVSFYTGFKPVTAIPMHDTVFAPPVPVMQTQSLPPPI